jgi:tetratricopeptide (TPR) repeat protein
MRRVAFPVILILLAATALAQPITTPPSGDNQKSSVTQFIGPVRVTIDYNSPNVTGPNGEDRRGKIWGTLVPWGFIDEPFGTCTQCPWRAGANEDTVLTVSHDVEVEGKKLPAGSYGVFLAPAQSGDWTLILSKNFTSWGHYTYDPAEDALRASVKPAKSEYHEWLTYEFTDRQPDRATVALKWEELQVPFTIRVPDVSGIYLAKIREQLRAYPGFAWENWDRAARYALTAKRLDDALEFAQTATSKPFTGRENFTTLTTLAEVQEARGMTAEATATRNKALNHETANAIDLHQYARQKMQSGNKDEAVRVWQLNAKRFPNKWPVNVGLMRAHSAQGQYKEALKYAQLALAQAPDEGNRRSLEAAVKTLGEGKPVAP